MFDLTKSLTFLQCTKVHIIHARYDVTLWRLLRVRSFLSGAYPINFSLRQESISGMYERKKEQDTLECLWGSSITPAKEHTQIYRRNRPMKAQLTLRSVLRISDQVENKLFSREYVKIFHVARITKIQFKYVSIDHF